MIHVHNNETTLVKIQNYLQDRADNKILPQALKITQIFGQYRYAGLLSNSFNYYIACKCLINITSYISKWCIKYRF